MVKQFSRFPYRVFSAVFLTLVMLTACADPIPDDYTEELVIEGFVISGEPLQGIKVYRSLPLSDTFNLSKAIITDATVLVSENGVPIQMEFAPDSLGGRYRCADTSFRVKENTE
jgi:hypothetical protein